jgi:hypothetical protein
MKAFVGALTMVAGLFVAAASSASDTHNTTIVEVRVSIGTPSVAVLEMGNDAVSKPACATYSTGGGFAGRWLAMDLSTDGGREAMKVALSAQLSGKRVRVTGSGTCTINSNKENLSSIYVRN